MTGRSIAHARRRIGVGQGGGSTRPDGTWRVLVLLGAMLPVAALAIERPQRPAPGTDARAAKTADVEVGAAEAPHFRIGPGPFDGLARGAETLVAAPDGRHLVVWPADLATKGDPPALPGRH